MDEKLIYIANIKLPTERAHGIQITKMCEAFAATGVETRLLISRRSNNIKTDIFIYYGLKVYFRIIVLPTPDLIWLGRFGFWSQNLIFSALSFFYCLIHSDFDLVYSRDELPLYFLSFLNKKIVWEMHSDRFNFLIKGLTKRILAIVAISAGLKQFLGNNMVKLNRVLVSPDAVDISLFECLPSDKNVLRKSLNLPLEKSLITYVGKYMTMNKDKGVDALIEAFFLVRHKFPNSRLLLVGIYETEVAKLKNFINQIGLSIEDCIIVTHRPHEEAMKYVKAGDVLIMNYPNLWHYALYMSPLKLFEYMASGNVIVSTSLPSIREVLSLKEAYLIKPADVAALADSIYYALTHPAESAQKAKSAYALVRQYTWENRAKSILRFIHNQKLIQENEKNN